MQTTSQLEQTRENRSLNAENKHSQTISLYKQPMITPMIQKQSDQVIQARENNTGMPDQIKSGLETLSGMDLSSVKVHYNSPKPAQLNAHAYTQGTNIHVASGQEKHVAHEGWHVVQQMQGRVQPTIQQNGVSINDDSRLEKEADVMGAQAERVTAQKKTLK